MGPSWKEDDRTPSAILTKNSERTSLQPSGIVSLQILATYVQFISYSKCSTWRRISKLLSNFGCLFTICYLDGANSIKTYLQTCNLHTIRSNSYKAILIEFPLSKQPNINKHPKFDNNFDIWCQLEHFDYEMIHAFIRRSKYTVLQKYTQFCLFTM